MTQVVPAILAEDVATAQRQLRAAEQFAQLLHVDVMDGTMVPRRTITIADLGALQPKVPMELHLMVAEPAQYFAQATALKVQRVLVHLSVVAKTPSILEQAQQASLMVGIVLSPEDELDDLVPFLSSPVVAAVLVMGIVPGRSGQKMLPVGLPRLREVHDLVAVQPHPIHVGFDGGVHAENIAQVAECGATFIVTGSAIFGQGNPVQNYTNLQQNSDSV